jgi:hypothetical protein
MTLRTRGSVALGLAAGAALACSSVAHAATVVTTGTLTGPTGAPAQGNVRVYAWPDSSKAMDLPLVGTARSAPDGSFTVLAKDERRLMELASRSGGWLDFTAVAAVPGREGDWTFTGFVADQGGQVRVVPADVASGDRTLAQTSALPRAPEIDLRAGRVRPLVATAARDCENKRQVTEPQYARGWTVVGELNNAYNDGTWARFRYGRASGADTKFGIAANYGGSTWTIGGEDTFTDEGSATFPTVRRRYSRRMRSLFEFKKQSARNNTCAVWDTYIKPVSWHGGDNDDVRVVNGLDRCDRRFAATWSSGAKFMRNRSAAVRYVYGVEVFGVGLTTQSGFSENVKIEYGFKGGPNKKHYLCGPDGRESPFTAGRILSGGLK